MLDGLLSAGLADSGSGFAGDAAFSVGSVGTIADADVKT